MRPSDGHFVRVPHRTVYGRRPSVRRTPLYSFITTIIPILLTSLAPSFHWDCVSWYWFRQKFATMQKNEYLGKGVLDCCLNKGSEDNMTIIGTWKRTLQILKISLLQYVLYCQAQTLWIIKFHWQSNCIFIFILWRNQRRAMI